MKTSFPKTIPRGIRKFAFWLVVAFLFYTVLGLIVAPPLLRFFLVKALSSHLARSVTIQKVRLNPYRLSTTICGLSIIDQDGSPLLSLAEAYLDVQIASLFTHPWVFNEVRLSQPFLHVQVNQDYTLNFSDIVDRFSAGHGSPLAGRNNPLSVRIGRLRLVGARIGFSDLTPRIPFARVIGPLALTILDFRTDPTHRNRYALAGIADAGETFSWQGVFLLDPMKSEGELSINGISLLKYASFYQDLLRFKITDGVVHVNSIYRYERSAAAEVLVITNTAFTLDSLKVADKDNGQLVAEVGRLALTGGSMDAQTRRAEAESIAITDGQVLLRRNQDTTINAIELSKPAASAPATPGGVLLLLRAMTNMLSMLLGSTNLANGGIRELTVSNCAMRLEDLAQSRRVQLNLEGISVQARNVSNRAGTNLTATVSLRWDTNGTIRAAIKAAVSPTSAEVTLEVNQLNLRPLAPYLERWFDVLLLRSKLGLTGILRFNRTAHAAKVGFRGDAWIDDFSLAEGITNEGLLRWNSLRLLGIDANLNPPVFSLEKLRLEDAYARLTIETNRTLNLMRTLRRSDTNALHNSPPTNRETVAKPKISIASLVVSNANVHFTDRSLQPHVNINLGHVHGALTSFSSDQRKRADLHFEGTVDEKAQAVITGNVNPGDLTQTMDLSLSLRDVSLLPADPYAARYLGYRLSNGQLSAQLDYQLHGRNLKSSNRLMFDQLTLGQKVASPEATRLPVRLAIAMLKDRDGRIVLDIPIEGALDDLHFNLGTVAYHALEKALTGVVASPFTFLAALFGGRGEEVSFQEFLPGSAHLSPAAIAKLDILAHGLTQRPELNLQIEGSADPQNDLAALRRAALGREPLSQGGTTAERLVPTLTTVHTTNNSPDSGIRKAFTFEKGSPVLRPEVTSRPAKKLLPHNTGPAFADDKGATALMMIPAPMDATDPDAESQRLEAVVLPPDALGVLAKERAQTVRAYLVQTGKVASERITVSTSTDQRPASRVYVRLQ